MATLTETQNQEKIIELLQEIKGVLEEIRDQETEGGADNSYTCDWCEAENDGEPEEIVNKYTFCSSDCRESWENDTDN